jgi:hypothetical protein
LTFFPLWRLILIFLAGTRVWCGSQHRSNISLKCIVAASRPLRSRHTSLSKPRRTCRHDMSDKPNTRQQEKNICTRTSKGP